MRDHVTYDWEFIDDGSTIDPVSLGMMRKSDGATLYAVSRQFDEAKLFKNDWMVENVWPHLPTKPCDHKGQRGVCQTGGKGHLDRDHPDVRPLKQIARMAELFITQSENPLLWAYYAAYDHVTLAQLWGPMMNRPIGVPMHTMDIKQEMVRLDLESDDVPCHNTAAHNALADAVENMEKLEFIFNLQGGDPYNPKTPELRAESF